MKLKLTKNQLEGLIMLLRFYIIYEPNTILMSLLNDLVEKLLDRLINKRKKILASHKNEISLTLNDVEAKAFYSWYANMSPHLDAKNFHYEKGLADKIFNQIDKHYAGIKTHR